MSRVRKPNALEAMGPAELRAVWQREYRTPAPVIGPDLMRRAIAWRRQERIHGGLSSAVRRDITAMITRLDAGKELLVERETRLKVGTRLVREWHGKSYDVLVCDEGYEHDGRRYDSLVIASWAGRVATPAFSLD